MPISPARTTAFDILLRVEEQNAYASELLHSARLEPLTVSNRGLTTDIVMGVLRWRSRLDEVIAAASSRSVAKLDIEVLTALRLGAYQLHYLSRIPRHAAINDSVELVKRARKSSAAAFVNAVLRKVAEAEIEASGQSVGVDASLFARFLAREYAHPEWLVERWIAEFGEQAALAICKQDQRVPNTAVWLDSPDVERELQDEGIELAPGQLLSSARIVVGGNLTRTQAFQAGRVFVQDEGSQLVAALMGGGLRVLDCCAAPGGKTAALAARNPTATILAAELHAHRAEQLRKRVRASNVQVIQADALHLPTEGGFDRVLADVPCSGTGTLARHPEIKWRLKAEDLADLHDKQVAIVNAALRQLASGGRLVYSTCSLECEENQAVIEDVLRKNPGYRLRDCGEELERLRLEGELVWNDVDSLLRSGFLRTIPGEHPCDGFFAAVIERVE